MATLKNFPAIFLLALMVGILALTWKVFTPFITVIVMSAILSTVFYPLYKRLLRIVKSKNLAALFMLLLVVVVIILPTAGIIMMLAKESLDTYVLFETKVLLGDFDVYLTWFSEKFAWIMDKLPLDSLDNLTGDFGKLATKENLDLIQKIAASAQQISGWIVEQGVNILSSTTQLLVNFFLMLFTMFYFFKDGNVFIEKMMHWSPISMKYEKEIVQKFYNASSSIIFGTFVTAVIQGVIGAIGFWIVGFQPLVWGVAMAFFSLIPVVGAGIIWVPGVIVLFIAGQSWAALFLLIWGILVISTSDNLARPYLMEGKMHIHPLIILFSIIGGLVVFGFLGILFGPLIVALAATIIHVYELEYKQILDKGDKDD